MKISAQVNGHFDCNFILVFIKNGHEPSGRDLYASRI